jgi:hypothetical protein
MLKRSTEQRAGALQHPEDPERRTAKGEETQ